MLVRGCHKRGKFWEEVVDRQVYLHGWKTLFDKIGSIFTTYVVFVFVQNSNYGGKGSGEDIEKFLVGLGFGRKESSAGFVVRCL